MPIHVRDSAQMRLARLVYAYDTAWRDCQKVFVHDGVAWRQVFTRFTPGMPTSIGSDGGSFPGQGFVTFQTDGSIYWSDYGAAAYSAWGSPLIAGIGAAFWIKFTSVSGSYDYTTPTPNVWHSLASAMGITAGAGSTPSYCQATVSLSTTNNDSGIVDTMTVTANSN